MPKLELKDAGGRSVQQWDITREALCVGRGEQAGVRLDDDQLSRRHFEVQEKDGGPVLRDLGSRNGTTVNGQPVQGETPLFAEDVIRAGRSCFVVVDGLTTMIGKLGQENYASFVRKL
jgi:pSer/pThr/pTyr-binding forkhead associated (FHA) protein